VLRAEVGLREAREELAPGGPPQHAQRLLGLSAELPVRRRPGLGGHRARFAVARAGPGSYTGPSDRARNRPWHRASPRREGGSCLLAAARWPSRFTARGARGARRPPRRGVPSPPTATAPSCVRAGRCASRRPWARWLAAQAAALLAIGDGALRFREQLEAPAFEVGRTQASSHRLGAGAILPARRGCETLAAALPDYLRAPDAEIALGTAQR